MAVDETLISEAQHGPILRLYEWERNWASLGYFQKLAEVQDLLGGGVNYVRRWTAGGLVDHRHDITYSLIIPLAESAARLRGGEGYCEIHRAVVRALKRAGVDCDLTERDSANESEACFEKPVRWDVVGESGKLAGAGQRRGKWGVLHQGSVMGSLEFLAEELAETTHLMDWNGEIPREVVQKYEADSWLTRR